MALLPSSTKIPVASRLERRSAGRVVVVGGSVLVVVVTVVDVGVASSVVDGDAVDSDATDVVVARAASGSSDADCCQRNQAPTATTPATAAIATPIRIR